MVRCVLGVLAAPVTACVGAEISWPVRRGRGCELLRTRALGWPARALTWITTGNVPSKRLEKLRLFADEHGISSLSPGMSRIPSTDAAGASNTQAPSGKISNEQYERIIGELQMELVKMQAWVKEKGV